MNLKISDKEVKDNHFSDLKKPIPYLRVELYAPRGGAFKGSVLKARDWATVVKI